MSGRSLSGSCTKLSTAVAVLAVVAIPAACLAQALPAAQYGGSYVVNADVGSPTMTLAAPGLYGEDKSGPYGGTASTALSITTSPSPALSLVSSVGGPAVNGVVGSLNTFGALQFGPDGDFMAYNVEFLGPTATVPIQVNALVQASLSTLAPGTFPNIITEAHLFVGRGTSREFLDDVYIQDSFAGDSGTGVSGYTVDSAGHVSQLSYDPLTGIAGSVADTHLWMAQTGVVYTVALGAYNELGVSGALGGGSMTVSALVDPTFQISSTATDPGLYSVILSPDIGNASVAAVPEPQTSVLLLAGLCSLCATVSRRRRS